MRKSFKHLSYTDRVRIEMLYKQKYSIKQIAAIMKVNYTTISRELKRGRTICLDSDLKEHVTYSCDLAHKRYLTNLQAKGVGIKLGNDFKLALFIEEMITKGFSPEATLGYIKGKHLTFNTSICTTTLYSYIDKEVFGSISNKDLVFKKNKKRKYRKVRVVAKRSPYGCSIEKRDKHIANRTDFGHWEIDTVKGKRSSKFALLVLTERKTRYELIFKLAHCTADSVNLQIQSLKRKFKDRFKQLFKSFTCDNGVEFARLTDVHQQVYYCHPYSSWERGSNEVNNRFIRRFIPKGKDIKNFTKEYIQDIQSFMNGYPRAIFNYQCSLERFNHELSLL